MYVYPFNFIYMENFYDFVEWCFRSEESTVVTLIILGGVASFLIKLARIFSKKF